MTEEWDVLSVSRELLGETVQSDEELKQNEYRLVVGACIFNSKNQLLIQKRQSDKKSWPDYWDISAAGSAIAGESSNQAIIREVKEELGLNLPLLEVLPQLSVNFTKGFQDYYLVEKDLELEDIVIQEEEVQDVKWASQDEIMDLINKEQFVTYHTHLIGLFFEMKSKYGSFKKDKW